MCDVCMCSYHSLRELSARRLVELQGELQVLRFEKERDGLVHHETVKSLGHFQLKQEKLQKKVRERERSICLWI